MNRGQERKNLFKKQDDLETGRRRREETVVQLRKSKKEEQLMKRRQASIPASTGNDDKTDKTYTQEDIPNLMVIFQGNASDADLLKAIQGFRRMLSVETNPPVNEVLAAGALPYLVANLEKINNPEIMFEAAWAVTNIASTDRTKDVYRANAIPLLVKMLFHEKANVREQAAWCLGNVAGDCIELRNHVLEARALDGLVLNINEPETMALLSNVTWSVSNLCRGKPLPPKELIEPAIAPLAHLLKRDVSQEVVVDAVWALSYLSDGDNERIQMVMDTGVTPNLIELLKGKHVPVLTPLVRTLGNFVTGTDEQTQQVIDAGVVEAVSDLLDHPNRSIRKETCWLLSNIAAGTPAQNDELFKHSQVVEKIVDIARNDRWEIRKEAIWVLANIFTTGNDQHVRSLVQKDGFQVITAALDAKDMAILKICIESIERVLSLGVKLDLPFDNLFDEYNGIDMLEDLQTCADEQVYESAVAIIETFFGVEDEEEAENIAPATAGGVYGFGVSKQGVSKQLFPSSSSANVFGENFNFGDTTMQH